MSLSCSSTHHSSLLPHGTLQNTHLSFPNPSLSGLLSLPQGHGESPGSGVLPLVQGRLQGRAGVKHSKQIFLKLSQGAWS